MVMEDPNSYLNAQIVGREFVRQYYTLMNEAPQYLHRFYSSNSSFIHGGIEKPGMEAQPVLGQNEIHKKIEALEFKDCHAKIRQVDSQSTVNQAVVVQVTGELSNKGGPLRRFMQTFVLAPQNPKQYYVHNDIFRYQDEVFQDCDDSEEEMDQMANDHAQENGLSDDGVPEHQIPEQIPPTVIPEPAKPEPSVEQPAVSAHHAVSVPASDQSISTPVKPAGTPSTQGTAVSPMNTQEPTNNQPDQLPKKVEEVNLDATTDKDSEPEPEKTKPSVEQTASETPAKNFSWANVVNKSVGGNPAAVAVVPPMNSSTVNPTPALPLQVIQMEESTASVPETKPPVAPASQPPNRSNRSSAEPGINKRPPRNDEAYGERRNERYPDSQQVFVGNLPLDVAEFDLRKFFSSYGKVIECRINRGSPNGNKVPFGFVVFDNEEPVKHLLSLKRVEMEGHRLNVEEKKARGERTNSSGRDRVPRGQRPNRAGSRPKERENSGTRHDNKPHGKGFGGGGGGGGGPKRMQ